VRHQECGVIRRETETSAVVEMTLAEMVEGIDGRYVDSRNPRAFKGEKERSESMKEDSRWYGGLKSVAQARKLVTEGWREGANRLAESAGEVSPPQAKSRKRTARFTDDGDELRVDQALRGDWHCAWRSTHREWSPGPAHVTVFASFGGHCGRDDDELFWAGAAALIVTDRLEAAGYAVRLVGSRPLSSYQDTRALRADVVLKETNEPLQIDALASVVCHSGVFRSFGFAAMAAIPGQMDTSLGCPITWENARERFEAGGEWPEGAIVIEAAHDRDSCIRAIDKALTTIA
jgi:hypothetical protein